MSSRKGKCLNGHARAALPSIAERDTPLGRSAKELMSRTHRNVAVVASANKLARIVWAALQTVSRQDGIRGRVAFVRSGRRHRSCERGLREGNDEMA